MQFLCFICTLNTEERILNYEKLENTKVGTGVSYEQKFVSSDNPLQIVFGKVRKINLIGQDQKALCLCFRNT